MKNTQLNLGQLQYLGQLPAGVVILGRVLQVEVVELEEDLPVVPAVLLVPLLLLLVKLGQALPALHLLRGLVGGAPVGLGEVDSADKVVIMVC